MTGIGRSTKTTLLVLIALLMSLVASGCAPHRRGSLRPPPRPDTTETDIQAKRTAVRDLTLDQLGTPYLYGGQTPGGFDCSGLVLYVYREIGIKLPRSARDQSRSGAKAPMDDLRSGDLVFFSLERDIIGHVGIYVGDGDFVHAPGAGKYVRKDSLDNSWWRSRFKAARRILIPARG